MLNGAANGAFHRRLGCQQERFETEEAEQGAQGALQGAVLVMSNSTRGLGPGVGGVGLWRAAGTRGPAWPVSCPHPESLR